MFAGSWGNTGERMVNNFTPRRKRSCVSLKLFGLLAPQLTARDILGGSSGDVNFETENVIKLLLQTNVTVCGWFIVANIYLNISLRTLSSMPNWFG